MGASTLYPYLKDAADEIGEMVFKQNVKQGINANILEETGEKIDTSRFTQKEVTRTVL